MLFAISAICGTILSPYVGKLIDRIGYKTVMISDTLLRGGWVWRATGIQTLFTISAIIGLLNSAFAATIKSNKRIEIASAVDNAQNN